MVRYLIACVRFKAAYWWLTLTGRRHKDAPEYLLTAYNAQAAAWNRMQNRKG